MRVIVAGSRSFWDYSLMREAMDDFGEAHGITRVVSGTAKGADYLGEMYAEERGIPVDRYPADWRPNGVLDRGAGKRRNTLMSKNADALVAFWDGHSRGTAHMIEEARKRGLLVRVVEFGA